MTQIKNKPEINKQNKKPKEIKKKEEKIEKIINKESEEEENENENNFYSNYDEYYSKQPLLLKESNQKTKYNEIDLNNFYPKLNYKKPRPPTPKPQIEENFDSNDLNFNQNEEQMYNIYYKKNELNKNIKEKREKKEKEETKRIGRKNEIRTGINEAGI